MFAPFAVGKWGAGQGPTALRQRSTRRWYVGHQQLILPNARPLTLLSDFAGMDVPAMSLMNLGVLGPHVAFEIDDAACTFLVANYSSLELRGSVEDRDERDVIRPDIVTAGFPCQPFSALGLQGGWNDHRGRGQLVTETLDTIMRERPMIVMLENVASFVRADAGRILDWIITVLSANQLYTVVHKVFCASSCVLPQTRKR